MTITNVEITGIEFPTAGEAIQYAEAGGGEAIRVWRKNLVVKKAEAERIAALGVEFAYLHIHEMPDGTERFVTVPIN
jgi:hypothetical protein